MPPKPNSPPRVQAPATNRSRRKFVYWAIGLLIALAAIIVQLVMSGMSALRNAPRQPTSPQGQREGRP